MSWWGPRNFWSTKIERSPSSCSTNLAEYWMAGRKDRTVVKKARQGLVLGYNLWSLGEGMGVGKVFFT